MNQNPFRFRIFILILLSLCLEAEAKDLGQLGTVFEIAEEGFITMIKRRLSQVNIEEHQRIIAKKAREQIAEPKAVIGLKKTETARTFIYDPTYSVTEDIYLPGGKLLYAKGHKVNPFDHISLDYRLFFIDGRDKSQVKWFKSNSKENDRLILVAGRAFDIEAELEREAYFDQFGELITKSGIKQVPAFMRQEGNVIRVQEVKIND